MKSPTGWSWKLEEAKATLCLYQHSRSGANQRVGGGVDRELARWGLLTIKASSRLNSQLEPRPPYAAFALISLILPIIFFIVAASNRVFDMPGEFITAFALIWLIFAFVAWINFQIWWNRREKALKSSSEGDAFTTSMPFAHLDQTFGESMGVSLAITGIMSSLF